MRHAIHQPLKQQRALHRAIRPQRRLHAVPALGTRERAERELRLDAMLDDSFPASDPPCWTLGRHF